MFGIGIHVNDLEIQSVAVTVNSGNSQTPLTVDVQFETGGPTEITGSTSLDIVRFQITIQLTLRPQVLHLATGDVMVVDTMGWVDDINGIKYTPLPPVNPTQNPPAPIVYQISGTFLGQPVSGTTIDPGGFTSSLIGRVIHVVFNTSSVFDPGDTIQAALPGPIFNHVKSGLRDSINAQFSSWLMGNVTGAASGELVPYQYPCVLNYVGVINDVVYLDYNYPAMDFQYPIPSDWPNNLAPGTLANIDHIVVLLQENRSFDHMIGYLSLPFEKGGMNRKDVDGLKGGEFNMFNGRKCSSFRLAAGDTIFSPGPPNDVERVATAINGGKMDGFVQAQADECGTATAHRVMGYHTADNVPTYDSLARDFAVCHRWFAPHPGPTFPNRFYELTGRPNVDPGAHGSTRIPVL